MTPRYLATAVLFLAFIGGCAATNWRRTAPWNFPPAHEWNAPLETSWLNFLDAWRRLTTPPGTVYDPVMQNYQPDLGRLLEETNP